MSAASSDHQVPEYRRYSFRLYANKHQDKMLKEMLETHRHLYNSALDGSDLCWTTSQTRWTFAEQCRWLTRVRGKSEWLSRINVTSGQKTLRRLDRAFSKFFAGGGYPKFKRKGRFTSFSFDTGSKGGGCKLIGNRLRVQHIGEIKIKMHREIPSEAISKECSIVHKGGKWYACFCLEMKSKVKHDTARPHVGIDLGIKHFIATSDGEFAGDSRILEREIAGLRRLQRSLSRCKKGSNAWKARSRKLSILYLCMSRKRSDMQHKLSRSIAEKYSVISVENLQIKNMLQNSRISRRIAGAGWYGFVEKLRYKARELGSLFILVDPAYTTQTCSRCGHVKKKSLSDRTHNCTLCGLVMDRDTNAAKNILAGAQPWVAKLRNTGV